VIAARYLRREEPDVLLIIQEIGKPGDFSFSLAAKGLYRRINETIPPGRWLRLRSTEPQFRAEAAR
jgi:hypothetical protein